MKDLLNRKGNFKIDMDFIESNPEEVITVFKDVLVVDIQNNFMNRILTYSGYSKHFDIIELGCVTPQYTVIVNKDKTITWKREKEYTENDVKIMLSEILNKISK